MIDTFNTIDNNFKSILEGLGVETTKANVQFLEIRLGTIISLIEREGYSSMDLTYGKHYVSKID